MQPELDQAFQATAQPDTWFQATGSRQRSTDLEGNVTAVRHHSGDTDTPAAPRMVSNPLADANELDRPLTVQDVCLDAKELMDALVRD